MTDPALPAAVHRLIGTSSARQVWRNEVGGLTFELDAPSGRRFLKWLPGTGGRDFEAEIERLHWAGRYWPVPAVLDHGEDSDGSWMITAGLNGDNAISERWLAEPAVAVTAIGEGLRALHEKLSVSACPFSWSANDRVADAHRRENGLEPTRWNEAHHHLSVTQALAIVDEIPEPDLLVVCHGDACAPNTLLDSTGQWSAHVDLGSLGVADRWADLAVATWSAGWNYGPGWEPLLLAAYGIEAEPERTAYYRLLWDLGP